VLLRVVRAILFLAVRVSGLLGGFYLNLCKIGCPGVQNLQEHVLAHFKYKAAVLLIGRKFS
jgi:hypothetical protein